MKVAIDTIYTVSKLSLYMDTQIPFLDLHSERLLSRLNHIRASTSSIRSQTTLVTVKATLTIAVLSHLSLTSLNTTVVNDGSIVEGHLRGDIVLAITARKAFTGDEHVKEAGNDESTDDEEDDHVHEDKAVDIGRIVAVLVEELGVGEGEDQCNSRAGDIFETDGPDPVDFPVLAAVGDDTVEITSELLTLEEF